MKKILVIGAAVVMATVANAATFKWSAANVYGPDGTTKYTGTAQIFATGVTESIGTATISSGTLSLTKDWTDAVVGDSYTFYFVINDEKGTFTSAPSKSFQAAATQTTTVAFGNMASATQNASNWAAVPEPTSGLMLLLGVAGLALKRKRA